MTLVPQDDNTNNRFRSLTILPVLQASIFRKLCHVSVFNLQIWNVVQRTVEQILSQRVILNVIYVSIDTQMATPEIVDAVNRRHSNILDASNQIFKSDQVSVEAFII